MEKVFELGRQFRNEGADFKHNPEFTSLEVYETYGDYDTMRVLTQEIIQEAAIAIYGAPVARRTERRREDRRVRPLRGLAGEDHLRGGLRRRSARRSPPTPRSPSCCATPSGSGWSSTSTPSWGFVLEEIYGELCERTDHHAGLLHRLPQGERTADPAPPPRPAARREVGPGDLRGRAGHGVLRARGPGRPARAAGRRSRCWPPPATPRRCRSTRTSSRRSSTACPRPVAWASASTGW